MPVKTAGIDLDHVDGPWQPARLDRMERVPGCEVAPEDAVTAVRAGPPQLVDDD